MDVGYIRPPFCYRLLDFTARPERVQRIKRKPYLLGGAEGPDLLVMPGVEKDFMPVALQKSLLGKSHRVLAAELLKEIVNEENFQNSSRPGLWFLTATSRFVLELKPGLARRSDFVKS